MDSVHLFCLCNMLIKAVLQLNKSNSVVLGISRADKSTIYPIDISWCMNIFFVEIQINIIKIKRNGVKTVLWLDTINYEDTANNTNNVNHFNICYLQTFKSEYNLLT